MLLWGSLFPCIKIGYKVFGINTGNTSDILVFAAMRFVVCGMVVCLIARLTGAHLEVPKAKSIFVMCVMGIFAIVLHYSLTYVGLSMTDSSKTALLKQFGPLLYSCFSFLFIKSESYSKEKLIGAIVGFCGIAAICTETSTSAFAVGDILILAASFCTVISMIISGRSANGSSPFWITGISQLFGGIVLLAAAFASGGNFPQFSTASLGVFAYICTASIAGYTIFYYVQRKIELSRLFIVKFAEPFFACVFGAILLDENIYRFQYLAAFLLISAGICIANRKGKAAEREEHHESKNI